MQFLFCSYAENSQVQIHEQDRVREEGFDSSAPSSIHDSDESSDESGASDDEEGDSIPASQEETQDDEGVMPDEIEEGHSPIDGLKTFDWGEAEDELREFIGDDDDSENVSDASTASTSSRQSRASNKSSRRERKRKHDEASDESDSDEESTLAKKQRIANSRTTGLKTVKTPNSMQSESSLPTPGVTGDEDGDDEAVDQIAAGDDDDDGFGDDLEADLMAEFDREELEAQEAG